MQHLLVVSGGGGMTPLLRQLPGDVRASLICRNRLVAKVIEPQRAPYLVSVPDTAPASIWADLAEAVHRIDPFDHVVSFSETDQDKVPVIAERLALRPAHSALTVERVYDKLAMRQALAAEGLDDTLSAAVSCLDDVRSFADRHGYPVILKPRAGTASVGVSFVARPADLEAAYSWAFDSEQPWNGELVVEQFLHGAEYSVECFSECGEHVVVAVTQKSRGDVHFVESGHVLPAPVSSALGRQLAEFVTASLTALGVTTGPTHTEVIVTESGPRMVETHVRLGGDEIPELICDAFKINVRLLWARQARGERIMPELRAALAAGPVACAGVRFVMPQETGPVAGVTGLDEARASAGVVDARQLKFAGDAVAAQARGSFDRCALVRAVGPDAAAVTEVLDRACTAVSVVLDRDRPADGLG